MIPIPDERSRSPPPPPPTWIPRARAKKASWQIKPIPIRFDTARSDPTQPNTTRPNRCNATVPLSTPSRQGDPCNRVIRLCLVGGFGLGRGENKKTDKRVDQGWVNAAGQNKSILWGRDQKRKMLCEGKQRWRERARSCRLGTQGSGRCGEAEGMEIMRWRDRRRLASSRRTVAPSDCRTATADPCGRRTPCGS